jgi:hypothetical protein
MKSNSNKVLALGFDYLIGFDDPRPEWTPRVCEQGLEESW